MNDSGIYKIQSRTTGEVLYVGGSTNMHVRWSQHKCSLKTHRHRSLKLQSHVNEYGLDDLRFQVLENCGPDELLDKEQDYTLNLNPSCASHLIIGQKYNGDNTYRNRQMAMNVQRLEYQLRFFHENFPEVVIPL